MIWRKICSIVCLYAFLFSFFSFPCFIRFLTILLIDDDAFIRIWSVNSLLLLIWPVLMEPCIKNWMEEAISKSYTSATHPVSFYSCFWVHSWNASIGKKEQWNSSIWWYTLPLASLCNLVKTEFVQIDDDFLPFKDVFEILHSSWW